MGSIRPIFIILYGLLWVADLTQTLEVDPKLWSQLQPQCPQLVPKIWENKVPYGKVGNNNTMKYQKVDNVTSVEQCFQECCKDLECNIVFLFKNETKLSCFKVIQIYIFLLLYYFIIHIFTDPVYQRRTVPTCRSSGQNGFQAAKQVLHLASQTQTASTMGRHQSEICS